MTPVVLSVFVIGALLVVVAIYFSIVDLLRNRVSKRAEPLVAHSTAPVPASMAGAVGGPVGVGYLDV